MKLVMILTTQGLVIFVLVACGSATVQQAEATFEKASATALLVSARPTLILTPTMTAIPPTKTREPSPFPLSESGLYSAGKKEYTIFDETRGGREIGLTVWYPALKQKDADGRTIVAGAEVDKSGVPYPLILTGLNSGNYIFRSHLVSHGYVMVVIDHPDYIYDFTSYTAVEHPRDFLFVLDRIANGTLTGLEGIVDADRTGISGFSGDGYISLALSGVRIDPAYYLNFCAQAPAQIPPLTEWYVDFYCHLSEDEVWNAFLERIGNDIQSSEDGLWQPITDARIRAVVPMAPDGVLFFGDKGLSYADRPMLLIAPTEDQYVSYDFETTFIFEHVGSPEKVMVSFIGKNHDMALITEYQRRMNHFATAFFGYHLKGREDYAYFFSEDFVAQFDDLAWGVYEGE